MSEKSDVPPEICEKADAALAEILPDKSKIHYEKAYTSYNNWKKLKSVTETSQKVLLAYFKQLSEEYKPPTLWSHYSMLKSMINLREKINIDKFTEVSAFLKQKSRGYVSKKSKVFSADQIKLFLQNAPDEHDLDKKVIILFGIFGALRGGESAQVTTKDIERQGNLYYVKIPKTKTMKARSFIIPEEFSSVIEKYAKLRPTSVTSDRFSLNFQKGKCTIQVIGKNKLSTVPQKIAEFLHLPDAKDYTGHAFRRTSATMLVDAGANMPTLKRHGGWKSDSVAEGYIEQSMTNKKQIGTLFSKMIDMPTTSAQTPIDEPLLKKNLKTNYENSESTIISPTDVLADKTFHFTNCNITFNLK